MKYLIKYLGYVIRHKYFVFKECAKQGLYWQGLKHDLSKFMPSELFPYAKYFYVSKSDNKENFELAWLKHIHRNPHHWNYWVLDGEALPMPKKLVKEMVCDWIGAGRAQGSHNQPDEAQQFFSNSKSKMNLHLQTIILINEEFLR